MDLWRTLVQHELAILAFDSLRNQQVMTAKSPEGTGRQTAVFVPVCWAGKNIQKKHFLRLTMRRKKS